MKHAHTLSTGRQSWTFCHLWIFSMHLTSCINSVLYILVNILTLNFCESFHEANTYLHWVHVNILPFVNLPWSTHIRWHEYWVNILAFVNLPWSTHNVMQLVATVIGLASSLYPTSRGGIQHAWTCTMYYITLYIVAREGSQHAPPPFSVHKSSSVSFMLVSSSLVNQPLHSLREWRGWFTRLG